MVKEGLQKNFSLLISFIIIVLSVILAFAVMYKPIMPASGNSLPGNFAGQDTLVPGVPTYTFYNLSGTGWPMINATPKTDNPFQFTYNQTPPGGLAYSEYIIVYFREMPGSIDEFAANYGITPIFVKEEIKMAAFEIENHLVLGVSDGKTGESIEKLSNDSGVETAKKDTYMFIGKGKEINVTPDVKYPEYYKQRGIDYVPNQVIVGFWRLPPSFEEFGAKYGGKPINVTQASLSIQMVTFETKDMKSFIDYASKDHYVRYIVLNAYWKTS